jgi:hypothetical protein
MSEKVKELIKSFLDMDLESFAVLIMALVFALSSIAIVCLSLWLITRSIFLYSTGDFETFYWMINKYFDGLFFNPGLLVWWSISSSILLGYDIYISLMERILRNRKQNPEAING